jgi:hypothetical protein
MGAGQGSQANDPAHAPLVRQIGRPVRRLLPCAPIGYSGSSFIRRRTVSLTTMPAGEHARSNASGEPHRAGGARHPSHEFADPSNNSDAVTLAAWSPLRVHHSGMLGPGSCCWRWRPRSR